MKNFLILFFTLCFCLQIHARHIDSLIQVKNTPFQGSLLYFPNDGKAHPGLIILHGSEGGSLPYYQTEAVYLAAHGYAVLAYCWYNCFKNPITDAFSSLENIELRNTIRAIEWLKNSPQVHGKKIALLGASRGGEQAIVLGANKEAAQLLDAIVVHTPSDTVVSGFNWGVLDKRCFICVASDLTCFNNSYDSNEWDFAHMRWHPACGNEPGNINIINSWIFDGIPLKLNETIPIENFKKPIFITVGDKDELWDYQKSVRIAGRLKQFGRKVELHVFSGQYHVFDAENENKRHELLLNFLASFLQN